jgi:hypothetical protein
MNEESSLTFNIRNFGAALAVTSPERSTISEVIRRKQETSNSRLLGTARLLSLAILTCNIATISAAAMRIRSKKFEYFGFAMMPKSLKEANTNRITQQKTQLPLKRFKFLE